MLPRKVFIAEALVLVLPAILFLAITLPEVLRVTSLVLRLRETSHPEMSLLQALSGVLQWTAGAYAISVLAWLAVKTAQRRSFKFGSIFWLGVAAGAASTVLMYAPFGPYATAAVAGPSALLAAHSVYLQSRSAHAA